MNTKKRIVSFLLTLAILAGLMSTAAFALEGEDPPATCTCTQPCTSESVNQACPVCGADGADLAKCAATAPEGGQVPPATCTCTQPCTPESVNPNCPVCGAEGADLANCAATAPQGDQVPPATCTCTQPCTPDSVNAACPVCSAEGADLANCAAAQGGNQVPPATCTCTQPCTPETVNPDCPVCSAEGADLADCAAQEGNQVSPATCACTQPCTQEAVNPDCPVCGAEGADLADCAAALLGMNGAISPMSATGSGTEMDPFLIYTQEDLAGIASGSSGKYYKLANDITLTSDWVPIVSFSGTLDGGGYTISGLNVPGSSTPNLGGIVNSLKAGATIKNLNVIGSVTSNYVSNARVGGIVGINYGTVDNCTFSGSVTGGKINNSTNGAIGGIVGLNQSTGTITRCTNNADVSGQGTNELYVGGIAGSNHGTLANCTNTGAISGEVTSGSTNYGPIWGSENWETSGGYVGGIAGDTTENAANTGNTNAGEVIYNDTTVVEAHKHDEVHFTQALDNTLTGGVLAPGNYYLTGDIDLSAEGDATSIEITGTVNLCLNGYSIRSNASAGIFRIGAGGELNVYDCNGSEVGNGMITETGKTDHNPIFLHSGGTLRLYGGKIEAYRTAIVIDEDPATGGTDMTGGTVYIHGGTVSSTGTGYQAIKVNAKMTNSAVYIQGGTVTSANRGISAESGEIHISGGSVSGSTYALEASATSTSRVYLSGSPTLSGAVKISPASAADDAVLVLHAKENDQSAYTGAGLSIHSNETDCENKYVAQGVAEADMAEKFSLAYPEGYSLEYDADNKAIQIKKSISYTVTLPTDSGYTATAVNGSASPVAEDGSYSFRLEIAEGYYKTTAFAVKANGTELTENEGVYTISNIHENQNVTVQGVARDNTAPTVTIHLEENKWSAFPSSHAFSLFFKNAQTVTMTADDAGSGVAKREYFVSEVSYASPEALEAAAEGQWETYSDSLDIAPNSKNVIYAKATDKIGNVGYASSAGIVLYTDAAQSTPSISFTKTGTDAVTADVTLNGNTVDEIYCGNDMIAAENYTVSGGTITFYASWLNTLSAGNHTLTVHYNPLGVPYVDDAGNDAPGTTSIALSVSKAAGSVTITNGISKVYDGEPVVVEYDHNSTGIAKVEYKAQAAEDSAYTTDKPSAVGEYTVRVTVAADDNYTEASATKDFTIRYLEAPEKPYTLSGEKGDNGWYTSDVTITPPEGYTVSNALNGEYEEKLTIDKSADGVTIYLKNEQGQMTDAIPVSEIIKIDQDDPTITATGNTTGYLQEDTVIISASDGTSGVAKVEVRKEGGDFEEITDSYTVTENGSYTFLVTDHAGRTAEKTLVYTKLDAEKPVVTIDATTGGETYTDGTWTNKTITLMPKNSTANLGKTTYQYCVDGGAWQTYTGPVVVAADTVAEGAVYTFKATSASGVKSSEASITVKRDADAPSGDITIEDENILQSLDDIAFELFYNQNVEMTISGTDALSGVASIQYYRSTEILAKETLEGLDDWAEYADELQETAKDAEKFVYYVKVTDNAGNVALFGAKGVTFDLTAPKIEGVANGATYYTTQKATVTDANLASVTLNDASASLENNLLTLPGNVAAETQYTVRAEDKAGNSTTVTVSMKPIASLAEAISGLTEDNVTSDDGETITDVQTTVGDVDTANATEEETAALQEIKEECNGLLEKIDKVAQEIADVTEGVNRYDEDSVKSSDKADIEALIDRIDKLLDGNNLTQAEREQLEALKDKAEGLLERIDEATQAANTEDIQSVQDIDPEQAKPKDKEALEAAKEDILHALDDYESNYTEDEKEQLQETLAEIEEALNVIHRIEDAEESIGWLPAVVIPEVIQIEERDDDAKERYDGAAAAEAQEALSAEPAGYRIIEGDGSAWTKEIAEGLTFLADGPYSKFTGVAIDGAAISPERYAAQSQSVGTGITLSPDYLDTLSAGEHAISVLYTDGAATGAFTVAEKQAEPSEPADDVAVLETGGNSHILPWLILLLLLILGGAIWGLLALRRRKKDGDN